MQDNSHPGIGPTESGPYRQLAARQRTLAQHEVTRLLNDLAPERMVRRQDDQPSTLKVYRWPNRCILQGEARAVSLTWFPGDGDESLGELLVIAWRGTVSLPGSGQRAGEEAAIVTESTLHLEQDAEGAWSWFVSDRARAGLATSALAAMCREQMEPQEGVAVPR